MIGHKEVQKFMDDNVIPNIPTEFYQFGIEVQVAVG